MSLSERSRRAVWHPCTQMQALDEFPPLAIARAEGPWLYPEGGGRVLDTISSWWVCLFGHRHPTIHGAIKDQLDALDHTLLAGLTHEPAVALAEGLSRRTGGALGHAFYASDGASAIEIALKMAHHACVNRGQPQRRGFVFLERSYHGETLGALAVTDVPVFREAYQRLLMPSLLAPSPDARGMGSEAAAQRLEALLDEAGDTIAGVVLEPMIQAAGGMAFHDAHYLRRVREITRSRGIALIADEIAVGCGRTGPFFACEHAGIWPDLLCLSKGITGGVLPLSVVLSSDGIYEAFLSDEVGRGFLHSHSYSGNPLACRAGVAVLSIFENDTTRINTAARVSAALEEFSRRPELCHARHLGSIWAWDLSPQAAERAPADFAARVRHVGLQEGLLLRPIAQTLYVMPPMHLDAEAIDHLADRLPRVLDRVLSHSGREAPAWTTPSIA